MPEKGAVSLTADEALVVVAGLRVASARYERKGLLRTAETYSALADSVEERAELAWENTPIHPEG